MRRSLGRSVLRACLLFCAVLSWVVPSTATAADVVPWHGTATTTVQAHGDGWTWDLHVAWHAPVSLTDATARARLEWSERTVSALGCVSETHQIGEGNTAATLTLNTAGDGRKLGL